LSVQSLTPSLPLLREAFLTPRARERARRAPPQGEAQPAVSDADASEEPAPIIRPDLSGLADFELRTQGPKGDAPLSAREFLSAFSSLLASVSAGDVDAARNAATALQLELFGGPSALAATSESGQAAQTRMLNDLVALIGFARLGELGSAEASAYRLARDMQAALLAPTRGPPPVERPSPSDKRAQASPPQPASLVQGATAAYELLMDLDRSADAA
jgi:hypothetical protein